MSDQADRSTVRAHGSRLEPGEVEEIRFLAERGHRHQITDDQVLGLIETINSLSRRCSIRFQEAAELRAKLTEMIDDIQAGMVETSDQQRDRFARDAEIATRQVDDLLKMKADLSNQLNAVGTQRDSLSRQLADAMGQLREFDRDRQTERARRMHTEERADAAELQLQAIEDLVMRDSVKFLIQDATDIGGTAGDLSDVVVAIREIMQRRQAGRAQPAGQ